MLIFHHNDLDGRCAAAVVGYGRSDHEYVEVDYKDTIPVEKCRGKVVVVVDFSFKPEVMAEVRKIAERVTWCDHHVTAKDYPYQDLPGFRDFTNKGLSGCECTWRHFGYTYHRDALAVPRALKLIGDYDSWRMQLTPESLQFYEGMKLENTSPTSELWLNLIQSGTEIARIIAVGKTAIKYRDSYCASIRKNYGYETKIDGVDAYAANFRFGSKGFGGLYGKYPLVISYIHDGNQFTVSLYSETTDVSKIAKNHGGGGHKGAAGFVCDELPFARRK